MPPPEVLRRALTEERTTAAKDAYSAILESMCGATDDSQPVEQYDGTLGVSQSFVSTHQSAVCQVQWNDNLGSIYTNPGNVSGVRWGSGMMITDDIMLTCGHLFDQTGGTWQRPRQNGTTNIISPQEIATNMRVNFNYQVDPDGNLRTEQSFAIVELIEYRLGSVDMALCRIAGDPGATFGTGVLSTTDASGGQMICIIGHPAGQPKRIEAGPVFGLSGNQLRYDDIDTLGGNSGSAVLRESDGRIVGVHTNGGCNSVGFNYGMRIERIIGVSPTLQNLTRPKLKAADDLGKLKCRDDGNPPTLKFRDDGGSIKAIDDVKQPQLDKNPSLDGKIPVGDRPGGGFSGGPRPFVLSTPHHSSAWQQAAQDAGAPRTEAELAELEAEIAQVEEALASAEAEMQ